MSAPGEPGHGKARSTIQRKRQQEQRRKIRDVLMKPHPSRMNTLTAMRREWPELFEALLGVLDVAESVNLMEWSIGAARTCTCYGGGRASICPAHSDMMGNVPRRRSEADK